jgi:hypothetical protein
MDADASGTVEIGEITPITRLNGIIVDGATTQDATGSHTGLPNGSENPDIDQPWGFFGNTGMHRTTSPISVLTDDGAGNVTLDWSGWNVTWNAIPSIPMGGDTTNFTEDTGIASMTCTVDCSGGDTFTLDFDSHVPIGDASGFGGVPYSLHLEGAISAAGAVPVANPDEAKTIVGNAVAIDVTANDTSADPLTPGSVTIATQGSNGTAVDNADDTVTYTPNTGPDFVGNDSFTYNVSNANGPSNDATVSVDVQNNVAPVAVNDDLTINTVALDNGGGATVINVLDNDTDANNDPDLPGGIDSTSITILSQPALGTCTANADGTITYSQIVPSAPETDTCTYQVSDVDDFGTSLVSNTGTVNINVSAIQSDWPAVLPPNVIPLLTIDPGIPGDPGDTSVPALGGSYFTMQVSSDTLIYTMWNPGPAGGLVVGHEQPTGISHTGAPDGTEQTAIETGWNFFGNTGFTMAKNGGVIGNPDGTLEFAGIDGIGNSQGRFIITWNGIPEIDLGGSSAFPEDLGFATITCDPAPCADQSTYELDYASHVPPGDPSGFGGVPYTLRMEGTVRFFSDQLKVSGSDVTVQNRLTAGETGVADTEVDQQCVGDCFDYTIENVTGPNVKLVLPLAGGVPLNPVWRILDGGTWRSFDTSTGDTITSAPLGPNDTECPDPGDPAYGTGADGKPVPGHQCIQLMITDNGPNDKNPAVGIITDPSGMGGGGPAGGIAPAVDNRGSNTSGCSMGDDRIVSSSRSEWWLLAGFLAWLGWSRRKPRRH